MGKEKLNELRGEANGAYSNGEAVMELMRELHRGGATICMVTHDPRYAQHADRIVHLFDGQIVEEEQGAERREIMEREGAAFVRGHMIRVQERAFDAGMQAGADRARNRQILDETIAAAQGYAAAKTGAPSLAAAQGYTARQAGQTGSPSVLAQRIARKVARASRSAW